MKQTTGTLKALVVLVCIFGSSGTFAQVSVLTQHNNNSRTGLNAKETILSTSNVNVASFGKLFSRAVDGYIFAQPLYVPNLSIGGKTRNVIYIATSHNSVYAFDADDPNAAQPLWHVDQSLLGTPIPNSDICAVYPPCPYTDVQPEIGIISTPVIDPAGNTIYVVNRMKDSAGTNHFQLWALDLITGSPKFGSPAQITDPGAQFDPFQQLQRPGLLLLSNTLYVAFGSMGDFGTWHGWVFAYTASPTLTPVGTPLNVSPNGDGGGFWSGGTGLVADQSSIYAISSNGNFNGLGGQTTVPTQCGSCFLKLDSLLNEIDYYTPSTQSFLNGQNQDLGAGGLLLIPGTTLLIGGGKDGYMRLVDTTGMGGYSAVSDTALQTFQVTPDDIIGGPVFWNNMLYLWGPGNVATNTPDYLKAWKFDPGTQRFDSGGPVSQSTIPSTPGEGNMAALSLSANGTQPGSAIVWANAPAKNAGDATETTVQGTLYAFDATDLTHELWDSRQNPARDDFGNYAKFNSPTIANGKVYTPTFSGQLVVYGLSPSPAQAGSFVQVAAATPQSPTNLVQVSYPGTQSKGDLNIVVVGWSDSTSVVSSVTDTQGNIYKLAVGPTVGQNLTQSIYYAIIRAAGSNTVTVGFDQKVPYPDVRILEYAGIDNLTPLDTATGASGASGVTTDSGPLTTTFANDLIFGANTVSDFTLAPGTAFTSRIITQPDGDIAEDELVSSAGTYHATATIRTSNAPWVMQAAAFKTASRSGDFTLSVSGAQSVNAGNSATYTVTATPQNGFSGTVMLACTVPANMGMSCALTPASITPSGAPATATLTVNTTAPNQARMVPPHGLSPLYVLWLPLPGIALAGIGLGSWRRRLAIGLVLFLVLALTLLLAGCGGGGTSTSGGGGGSPGTPAGNYSITVTASAPGLPSHTQTVTLTVQ